MTDDMKMAHEYMMACIKADVPVTIEQAWQYVDGMYIEQDDRIDKSRPESIAEKSVVIRDGGYYYDHVNFEYYKLSGGKWFKIKSLLDPVWIGCSEPATTWLVENDTYK